MQTAPDIDQLRQGIVGWLASRGYPLEMRASRVLLQLGLGVRQGWNYEDPDTAKPREIDILASSYVFADNILLLQAVIECKTSLDPIVAFTYGRELSKRQNQFWLPANVLGRKFLHEIASRGIADRLPVFQPLAPVAYSLVQARLGKGKDTKSGMDLAFEATMATTKASHSLAVIYTTKVTSIPDNSRPSSKKPVAYIGIPAIVFDAPLFTCSLAEDGSPAVEPCRELLLEWSFPPVGTLLIRVINVDALPDFASSIVASASLLDREAKNVLSPLTTVTLA